MSYENKAYNEKSFAHAPKRPPLAAAARSGLLNLPAEVRLEIYDIYFASRSYNDDPGIPQRFRDPTAKVETGLIRSLVDRWEVRSDESGSRRETSNLNLLFVSKLIHAEAIPRFYHHRLFSLPTYCSPVPSSGWTGLEFEVPVLRLEQMGHFDLIRKMELVHQHLGDVVADRLHTDRAIGSLLHILIERCTSLRHLSIRVNADLKREYRRFYALRLATGGIFPYLDFRRWTPEVLQLLLPRLDRLEIHLLDSEIIEEAETCTRQPITCTWAWGWISPDKQQQKATTARATAAQRSQFFSHPSEEISPEVWKVTLAEDLTYSFASLEPFAHFSELGKDRGKSDDSEERCPIPGCALKHH